MTTKRENFEKSATLAGLSEKAARVYVVLLEAGQAVSPKTIILKSGLHRQYVYDGLYELESLGLLVKTGTVRKTKYQASSPDKLLQLAEKRKIDAQTGVAGLLKLYDRSPAGIVEVIRGSARCIESEFEILHSTQQGDFMDIIGGAGMSFVDLFSGRIEEWESLRKEKDIKLRYIGSGEDVEHNKNESVIENESRVIEGIGDIVNVVIRPESVSFNIYEPEIVTVRVRSKEAVASQRALFEVLWSVAK